MKNRHLRHKFSAVRVNRAGLELCATSVSHNHIPSSKVATDRTRLREADHPELELTYPIYLRTQRLGYRRQDGF